ncbi:hypothetical protein DFO67_102163 [Modicisalibacter xianhensis]|uniref:Uncharacterized protein n=1 Tax=Modicisalibacter xianhensis TaxID=442341 RepID=A0A1I3FWX7_9GAMM|nr:hypothetical protein DFO67_102163 [Halomonas xianhensis]SFI15740.1 hypothetical protein SAMN04487959_12224 [Halomonas xianhensis]
MAFWGVVDVWPAIILILPPGVLGVSEKLICPKPARFVSR